MRDLEAKKVLHEKAGSKYLTALECCGSKYGSKHNNPKPPDCASNCAYLMQPFFELVSGPAKMEQWNKGQNKLWADQKSSMS